jgi:hypothetical protein
MKDQYFGDFGDYQKISLLKFLQDEGFSLLVHWMKTKDDGSTDGKHISYLEKPDTWRSFDPEVFEFLRSKTTSGKRLLSHVEGSNLCKKVQFISDYIEDRDRRSHMLDTIRRSGAEVVLFDPDNGIEVASTNKKNIHKYVTWNEILKTFDSGKSVIIYQHFSRTNREIFVQNKIAEIRGKVACPVVSVQVRHSVYFFLMHKEHRAGLLRAIGRFADTWKRLAVVRRDLLLSK